METKNLKLVKACIYRKGDIYFPVAFMADPASAEYEYDQYNAKRRIRMTIGGMPYTNGCTIIPMGCCPIKGKFEMSLTNFEDILAKYDCHFHCVIPHRELKSASEVFDAFRWMIYGCNHLPNGNENKGDDDISLKDGVIALCREGSYMNAIAFYRIMKNCSFDKAKDAVDAIISE